MKKAQSVVVIIVVLTFVAMCEHIWFYKHDAGHGLILRDPSYIEMRMFLRRDRTDSKRYVKDSFVCTDFARAIKRNAENEGYFCYYINVKFLEGAHALIAFNTTDRGFIYIEPQSDEVFRVEIGKPYWPRTRYRSPKFDDTVMNIRTRTIP